MSLGSETTTKGETTMTRNQLKVYREQFFKEHNANEFKTPEEASGACSIFVYNQNKQTWHKERFNENTMFDHVREIRMWWFRGKKSITEMEVLNSLDESLVTHRCVTVHEFFKKRLDSYDYDYWKCLETNDELINTLADMSFTKTIVSVGQKPGKLELFIAKSNDMQTNITGEVIDKIVKCLEY